MNRPKPKPLHEQVIVVTGATSGIGLATVRKAAAAGAKVFLVARDEETLAKTAERMRSVGGEADFAVADVGDQAAVEAAADAALARFGRIDAWVENAGVAIYAPATKTDRDQHERLMRTNYWGVVNGSLAAVARMRQSGGALIVVGSLASDMASPDLSAYVASKHAVKGYVDCLRIELNRDRVPVRVTLIKPAGIGTPLDDHTAVGRDGAAMVPPPIYAPELVADAILASARRPIRELTVGGIGQLQILIATHFPGLFANVAGWVTPFLYDRKTRPPPNNLFAPGKDGEAHSPREGRGRGFSLYTTLELHPTLRWTALLGGLGLGAWLAVRRGGPRAKLSGLPESWRRVGRA